LYRGCFAMVVLMTVGVIVMRISSRVEMGQLPSSGSVAMIQPWSGESASEPASTAQIRQVWGKLPISFEPNQGQTDARVEFVAHGRGYGLFLMGGEAVLRLQSGQGGRGTGSSEIKMRLSGANTEAKASGVDQLPGRSNYLIGDDPAKWHRDVPQFARVRYGQVYPGIDLVYYGNQGQLEYDFEVAPGADPGRVKLKFEGPEKLALDAAGNLAMHAESGDVHLEAPRVYQRKGDEKQSVDGHFVLTSSREVGFAVGDYDRSRTLVIDPVLTYFGYLGGSGVETSPSIAVDGAFNIYVAGQTTSTNFPLVTPAPTPPPLQSTLNPPSDVFVAKLDPSGTTLLFSTYLGGTGDDFSAGIAVDASLNVYVTGTTNSANFPMANPANGFQTAPKTPGNHVFLSVLNPGGSGLLYSTYLSGSNLDVATGLAIDNKANAYVTGTTTSADFPTTPGTLQGALQANTAFFVSKINTAVSGSSSLVFSSFFGGGNPATGAVTQGGGIAVDSSGFVYITGGTNFLHLGTASSAPTDFPIVNAVQGCLDVPATATPPNPPPPCPAGNTATDAFVAKINPSAGTGAQLVYSTYLGGSGNDVGNGIAVDSGGNAYVTGSTASTDVFNPGPVGSFQATPAGGQDAFVIKLNSPAANTPVSTTYFSYIGTAGTDNGAAIAVDNSQIVRVAGAEGTAAFVARIDTTATTAASPNNSVTTLGTTGTTRGTGIALDTSFVTYVTGDTTSPNFVPVGTPFQGALNGTQDAFISKLISISDLAAVVTTPKPPPPALAPVGIGNQTTVKYTITNNGPDPTGGVIFNVTLPASGATAGTVTSSPGSCNTAVGSSVLCSIGSMGKAQTATVTVPITPTVAQPIATSGTVGVSPSGNPPSIDPTASNNGAQISIPVADFSITANPNTQTVAAGNSATYQVTVTPIPTFPNSVSLSCSRGLPTTGAACTFSTASLTFSGSSASTSTLTITTTARPLPTTFLRRGIRAFYAVLFPVSGLALVGVGLGGGRSRRRREMMLFFVIVLLATVGAQVACGGGKSTAPTTPGTAAGTYTVDITGTSGSASHTSSVTLIVQ
jgi:hypothetical protein